MKTKYYVVSVYGCVEPELSHPYGSYASMLKAARKIYATHSDEDGIFWLKVGGQNKPVMESFSTAELERNPGNCSYCGSGLRDTKGNCAKCGL